MTIFMSSLGRGAGQYFGTVFGGSGVPDVAPVRDGTTDGYEDAVPGRAAPVAVRVAR